MRNTLEIDIRKEIDRLLNHPLNDAEWGFFLKKGYVDEISRNPSTRDRVVKEVAEKMHRIRRKPYERQTEQKYEGTRGLPEQGIGQPPQPSAIISQLVAQEAAEDIEVHLFRTEVLGDKYLSLEEIEEWIQQQVQKDGPPTKWLSNIPVSRMMTEEMLKQLSGIVPDTEIFSLEISLKQAIGYARWETHLLEYPGLDGWERCIPTAIGGVLERLREAGNKLAKKYKWANQQATAFILTGRTPFMSPINTSFQISSRKLSSRIVLDIDPTLTPAEVAQYYRRNRKKMMPARHRNLSEKHMQLAHFNSTRPDNETWAIKMREWNKTQKAEWQYKTVRNFASDCKQARGRLLRTYANDLVVFGQQSLQLQK